MPGYIIHLTEAKLILECLKKMYDTRSVFSDQWTQCFFWGSLLPDAADKTQKCKSHFWKEGQEEKILRFPQTEWFLEKYQTRLEDPVILGYYAHLYLDRMFFSDFLTAFVSFYDAAGNKTDRIPEVSWAVIQKKSQKSRAFGIIFEGISVRGLYKIKPVLIRKVSEGFPNREDKKNLTLKRFFWKKQKVRIWYRCMKNYSGISEKAPGVILMRK